MYNDQLTLRIKEKSLSAQDKTAIVNAIKNLLPKTTIEPIDNDIINDSYSQNILTDQLTGREKQIYRFMKKGIANKAIGHQLNISENTVKRHLHNIFQKVGAKNKIDAINIIENSHINVTIIEDIP